MISRPTFVAMIFRALERSPIVALLGARQCGKTTLARSLAETRQATVFDLESPGDLARLQNPELALSGASGLVVIDEIQRRPDLFAVLRVLVDRRPDAGRFLILGSASPRLIAGVSESLAGRVEFIDLGGFNLEEVGATSLTRLWVRGGLPRSFLAASDEDSQAWREGFIRTFLERDVPQLGISIPAPAMRRFWTMLAHCHGQTWNASELARSMGLDSKAVRGYLDVLTATFMVRQLQPWFVSIGKRQVKAPKVFLRDSGLLHSLLGLHTHDALTAHPRVGASWEGFVLEQALEMIRPADAYFWATYQGAELDLLFVREGRLHGIEVKYSESPRVTRSMRIALDDLGLERLWVIHPGGGRFEADERIAMWPAASLGELAGELA
ncbi:MAG: ATP-binding protein [Candidatus Eisenbacteria bacterium]|uniref:ATP-binding protein n=1 Tax=Eiseniibacteriota bacterium TaxID=2212470 RepID=A0A937X6Z8_UNCEI|nr:ATP-binding protein [Candidatus Eisenbacteria bacterium]